MSAAEPNEERLKLQEIQLNKAKDFSRFEAIVSLSTGSQAQIAREKSAV